MRAEFALEFRVGSHDDVDGLAVGGVNLEESFAMSAKRDLVERPAVPNGVATEPRSTERSEDEQWSVHARHKEPDAGESEQREGAPADEYRFARSSDAGPFAHAFDRHGDRGGDDGERDRHDTLKRVGARQGETEYREGTQEEGTAREASEVIFPARGPILNAPLAPTSNRTHVVGVDIDELARFRDTQQSSVGKSDSCPASNDVLEEPPGRENQHGFVSDDGVPEPIFRESHFRSDGLRHAT